MPNSPTELEPIWQTIVSCLLSLVVAAFVLGVVALFLIP